MKRILIAVGWSTSLSQAFSLLAMKESRSPKDIRNRRYISIELGDTSYKVTAAEPVLNSKDRSSISIKIADRRNGNSVTDPTQTLKNKVAFISTNQEPSIEVNLEKMLHFIEGCSSEPSVSAKQAKTSDPSPPRRTINPSQTFDLSPFDYLNSLFYLHHRS
jgi:hypothetical protein